MQNLIPICGVALYVWAGILTSALPVQAADVGWRPNQTMYCSDGEFDWDSGQSLYDFVIQTRAPDDFIVSYLGIPHPSFETRDFFHIWMKMRGQFSSAFAKKERTRIYALQFDLDNETPRTGTLTIAADNTYKFSMAPPLGHDTTESGLCWASLPLTSEDRLPSCTPSPLEDTSKCSR